MRYNLLKIMNASLGAVNGRGCVARYLDQARPDLPDGPWYLFAVGKAAPAMAAGAREALDGAIAGGLLITKDGHCAQAGATGASDGVWPCLEAGHPRPDARSLAAGERLTAFLDALPAGAPVLSLISGGTSALVEVPVAGIGLDELGRVNDWLLGSGLDILAMNRIRSALSAIKGGRLTAHLRGHPVVNLLISDVPGDRPEVIGSGLLVAPPAVPSPPEEALPDWLARLLAEAGAGPALAPRDPTGIDTRIVASNADARRAAVEAAAALGLAAHDHGEALAGDGAACGASLAETLCQGPPGVHVWGGETTLRLPERPGRGGRNQHLALAAAQALAGREGVWLLALGTDGTDGPTEDAGALVDGSTVGRGEAEGLSAQDCLERADAGRFLAASGDLIQTGPTGTNVMDLVIGLKAAPA